MLPLFWITIVSITFSSLTAVGTETNAMPDSPFAPIAFLIGGTWRGELPPGTNELKRAIETKFEWTGNHQGIRFESAWVIGDKRHPYCSGIYFWNPGKRRLEIIYSDAQRSLTEGFIEMAGQTRQHVLTVVDENGRLEQVQSRMTHPDANSYINEIYTMENGRWQKLVSVLYERKE